MVLSKLSVPALNRLKAKIDAEIARRSQNSKRELLKKVKKLAADAGVPLSELLGSDKAPRAASKTTDKAAAKPAGKRPGAPRGKVAPKYRNPADKSQVWTGRGRQPLWVAAFVSSGKPLSDLLIK